MSDNEPWDKEPEIPWGWGWLAVIFSVALIILLSMIKFLAG